MAELDTQGQIQEFLSVLKRRKWGILLPMLYFLMVGLLIAVVVPKKVEVMTRVELKETRVESDPNLKVPQNNAATKEIPSAVHHIRHYARIKDIIEGKLQDRWELDYMGKDSGEKYQYITDVVMKNVDVFVEEKPFTQARAPGSWFINIRYKDVDGERAEEFLRELVARWVDDVIKRDAVQLEEEKEELQEALRDAEQTFAEANEKYTQVCKPLGQDPSQSLDMRREWQDSAKDVLNQLKLDRAQFDKELVGLETRIEQYRADLELMDLTIEDEIVHEGVSRQTEIQSLEQQIRGLELLREGWTPAHPRWKAIESRIEPLRREITLWEAEEEPERVETAFIANPRVELVQQQIQGLELEYTETQRKLEVVNAQIARQEAEQRTRSQQSAKLYELYTERELARIDRDMKAQALSLKEQAVAAVKSNYNTPYEVVQPPESEGAPVTPNTSILVVFFAIAGLGLGLVFSLLAEYGKNAYRSPHELSQVLPIPVLGAINAIVTSSQARRRHARRTIVGVSSLFILGGLGWFTFMIWKRQGDLPVPVQETLDDIRMMLL